MSLNMPVEQRLMRRVDDSTGCWIWTGSKKRGYAEITYQNKAWYAHRLSYEVFVGPIPEGLQLDHLCRNRACIRPDHLEPVTPQVNNLRSESPAAYNAKKTHCPQGHPYDENNTLTSAGRRFCRTCHRATNLRFRARRKESAA